MKQLYFLGRLWSSRHLKKKFCFTVAETRGNHPKSGTSQSQSDPGVPQNRSSKLISPNYRKKKESKGETAESPGKVNTPFRPAETA